MIAAYRDGLRPLLGSGRFDIVHAQDCLSANAALELRDEGTVAHVVRTVHHVDEFRSPSLVACQDRSIRDPDRVVCVSEPWVGRLRDEFGVGAGLVTNGVELERFRPPADAAARDRDRAALDLGGRAVRARHRRDRAAQGRAHAGRGLRRAAARPARAPARCS